MEPKRMRLRSRLAVVAAGALVASAVLAGSASAGLVVNPKVVGAGKVEDPGHYICSQVTTSNAAEKVCASGNGYVPPCDTFCLLTYQMRLTATPAPGWRFVGWAGSPSSCTSASLCSMSVFPFIGAPDTVYAPVATFHEVVEAA